MIVPLPKDKLSEYEAKVLRAITDRFGDYGIATWMGFGEIYITGWWPERECQYAIIFCHTLQLKRQLFNLFLKFDQGIAEHRAYYARRLAGEQNPPRPLDEVISGVYGFGWMLGFAAEETDCDLTVAMKALDFGFDLPALLIQMNGSAWWLESEEGD